MLGTLINVASIAVMGFAGYFAGKMMGEKMRDYLMRVIGLVVLIIGIDMALETRNFAVLTLSLLSGSFVGFGIGIERRLERFGMKVEKRFEGSKFAEGFVSGTILFCVGSMAVVGPIQEALTGDISVLLTKSILDGIASIVLSSTLGIGVVFSALPVLLYQSLFYFTAVAVKGYATDILVSEITAMGGVMISAIGLNLMKVADLRAGDMLPSFLFLPLYLKIMSYFSLIG